MAVCQKFICAAFNVITFGAEAVPVANEKTFSPRKREPYNRVRFRLGVYNDFLLKNESVRFAKLLRGNARAVFFDVKGAVLRNGRAVTIINGLGSVIGYAA